MLHAYVGDEILLMSMNSPEFIQYEHPLHHGKRIGVIRLGHKTFQSVEALKAIQAQLTLWQKQERILAIWFELESHTTQVSLVENRSEYFPVHQEQAVLLQAIADFPKASFVWNETNLTNTLSLIGQCVDYCLFNRADENSEKINYRLESNMRDIHPMSMASTYEKPDAYLVTYQRTHLFEVFSSHPWSCASCEGANASFQSLLEGGAVKED